jgi:hypothetical protein
MHTWQDLFTYPQHVSAATRSTLATLESLYPPPSNRGERALCVSRWLDGAVSLGLLTRGERDRLRSDIATNL